MPMFLVIFMTAVNHEGHGAHRGILWFIRQTISQERRKAGRISKYIPGLMISLEISAWRRSIIPGTIAHCILDILGGLFGG
jgi:hypothetical protein